MATFNGPVTIGQYNEVKGDNAKIDMTKDNPVATFDADEFADALTSLMEKADRIQRPYIEDAIHSAQKKDESAFISALKKVATVGGNILTQVASQALILYLRGNGILP